MYFFHIVHKVYVDSVFFFFFLILVLTVGPKLALNYLRNPD
jgi:hypothetical protein